MRERATQMTPFILLVFLLATSLSPLLLDELTETRPASRVEGRVEVDFLVESIIFGNASVTPQNWTQPDKSEVEFLLRGETMPIDITILQNGGQLGQFAVGTVRVEVIHPIGYVEWSATYTEEMTKGMRNTTTLIWTPEAAHSELVNDELGGGYTLMVSITTGIFDDDQDETNDVMQRMVPVALWRDELESGFQIGLTMQAYRYSKNTADGPDAVAKGAWQVENDAGIVGDDAWRHSNPGSNYPSNAFDRMVFGFSTGTNCAAVEGVTAVLEQGWAGDGDDYIWPYCRAQLDGSKYVSVDISTQVWGEMGVGDLAGLELWRPGSTGAQLIHEFENTSTTQAEWTRVSWKISDEEMNKLSWNVGFLFESDNFGANEGYHVDDFAIFAIENVTRFTLDVSCVDSVSNVFPELGFNVIPADPNPPGLTCAVHNNGYKDASVRVKSWNTNSSWLEPRIDHDLGLTYGDDVFVVIPPDESGIFWINQSIPPAAEVTDPSDITRWHIEVLGSFTSELHDELSMPIIVGYHDNAALWPKNPSTSFVLHPGESSSAVMNVRNTGNKHGTYEFTGIFPSERPEWLPWIAVSFTDYNGTPLTELFLSKGQQMNFTMHLTAPEQTVPGLFEVELQANGIRGTSAQAVYPISLEVLLDHELEMITASTTVTSEADGLQELIPVIIRNNGNTLETFELSLQGDAYPLRATLSTTQTAPLDPFGGESGVNVILPMNVTSDEVLIQPGEYMLRVTAVSTSDPTYKSEVIIQVIITDTYSVIVEDKDLEGQSYRGGQSEDTLYFKVENLGNVRDSFEISLDVPEGMNARVDGLVNSITPEIQPGSSFNVKVTFDFDLLTDGNLLLTVIVASTSDPMVSDNGEAVFTVGNLGWVKLLLSAGDEVELSTVEAGASYLVVVSESDEITLTLEVFNKHFDSQEVRVNFDDQISSGYFTLRVDELTSSFSIAGNDNRDIQLELVVPRSSLLSLPSEEFMVNLTIWVESDLDVAPIQLQVKLIRASVVEIEPQGSEVGGLILNILGIIFLVAILGALVFALVKVISDGGDDEDDISGGYEPSLLSHYGAGGDGTSVPSASSFLDGLSQTEEWQPPVKEESSFESASPPAAPAAPTESPAPPSASASPEAPQTPASQGGPPLPAEGLPAGWTMEQWRHYGQEWLERDRQG